MSEKINKIPAIGSKNFSPGRGGWNPGPTVSALFHPVGDRLLTKAELSDIQTNLQAKLVKDIYNERAFLIGQFETDSENNGEGVSYQTRAQLKFLTAPGTYDMIFYITGTYADYIMMRDWAKNKAKRYRYIPVDNNAAMRHLASDKDGIMGFETHAIDVQPIGEATSSTIITYAIRIALKNRTEYDGAAHTHITNADDESFDIFDSLNGLRGVEQGYIEETTFGSPGNGVHYIKVEGSSGEENFVDMYQAAGKLKQAGAWVLKLGNGTVVTITTVGLISVDNKVMYFSLTLDQTDYTNGDIAYLTGAAVSVLFPFIGRYVEFNTIKLTLAK